MAEPEVVIPKVVEKKAPLEKAKQEVKKLAAKNTAEHNRDKQKDGKKSGPKSDSKAASAAAASGGKFNPNAISRPHPPYPASARASRIEGSVVVRYTVSPSGSVTGVSVLSASPPGVFNGVTVSAVRNWRFRPSATAAQVRPPSASSFASLSIKNRTRRADLEDQNNKDWNLPSLRLRGIAV